MTARTRTGGARLLPVALMLCVLPCYAEESATWTVELFASAFLPQSVEARRGDRVVFLWRGGEHVMASGLVDGESATALAPGRLFDVAVNERNPRFVLTVDSSLADLGRPGQGIPFFDRLHPNQLGFLAITSGEESFRVGVVDNAFQPHDVFIFSGDSVLWSHEPNEMLHTVTSGLSSAPADNPGELFDEESSEAHPLFEYRFAAPGEYPYFCRPHEEMAMNGRVFVQQTFVRGDANGDSQLTITDALAVLGFLFVGDFPRPCQDAFDLDDNGEIDITDPVYLLEFLFLGGVCIARPFPEAGPDRTDDPLRCWSSTTL
jgi:plastocyanin